MRISKERGLTKMSCLIISRTNTATSLANLTVRSVGAAQYCIKMDTSTRSPKVDGTAGKPGAGSYCGRLLHRNRDRDMDGIVAVDVDVMFLATKSGELLGRPTVPTRAAAMFGSSEGLALKPTTRHERTKFVKILLRY